MRTYGVGRGESGGDAWGDRVLQGQQVLHRQHDAVVRGGGAARVAEVDVVTQGVSSCALSRCVAELGEAAVRLRRVVR